MLLAATSVQTVTLCLYSLPIRTWWKLQHYKNTDILWHFTVQIRFTRCLTPHMFNLVLVYSVWLGLLWRLSNCRYSVCHHRAKVKWIGIRISLYQRSPRWALTNAATWCTLETVQQTSDVEQLNRCFGEKLKRYVLLNITEMWRWTDQQMWCWTDESWCAAEHNRDVTLNRSTDEILNRWKVMCCWTVICCWSVEKKCALNSWKEMCCWTAEEIRDVEQQKRDVISNSSTQLCYCQAVHYRTHWPVP